jgi:hypothetical protein
MTIVICWIDDNASHKLDAENLEGKITLSDKKGKVLFYHPEDFKNIVESKKKVDLFLVDYYLNRAASAGGQRYAGKGVSFIGLLRENYPDTPIYTFTALPRDKTSTDLTHVLEKEAEARLDFARIQDSGHEFLYYDGLDYRTIRKTIQKGTAKLIDLLKPPPIEKEKIASLLPHILKTSVFMGVKTENMAGRSLDYASWVRNVLLARPGFLYNKLYSATAVGMTSDAFQERLVEFDSATYRGLFARSLQENLWWKIGLFESMNKKAQERSKKEKLAEDGVLSNVKRLAAYAFELKEDEIATCVVCDKRYPDTVGTEIGSGEMVPVHYRCSDEDPEAAKILFFDDRYIAKVKGEMK